MNCRQRIFYGLIDILFELRFFDSSFVLPLKLRSAGDNITDLQNCLGSTLYTTFCCSLNFSYELHLTLYNLQLLLEYYSKAHWFLQFTQNGTVF